MDIRVDRSSFSIQAQILSLPSQFEECLRSCLSVFRGEHPVVMLEMPAVYALIAPGNRPGVEALNRAKARLADKNYGSIIGRWDQFLALLESDATLPPFSERGGSIEEALEGTFLRAKVSPDPAAQSPLIRNGTHQGLLLPRGVLRDFVTQLEHRLEQEWGENARFDSHLLFAGKPHVGILATSANLSGDPLGSITDPERAADFVNQQRIPLWIRMEKDSSTTNQAPQEKGSYPIVELDGNTLWVRREGPGLAQALARLPAEICVADVSENHLIRKRNSK